MTESDDNQVAIFLTHKSEDLGIARQLINKLETYDPDERLKFFLAEDIVAGKSWLLKIQEELTQASVLLFLFTESTPTWDWCIYEAAFFEGHKYGSDAAGSVIILHNPSISVPRPFHHLQVVPWKDDTVVNFLRDFYCGCELTAVSSPINNALTESILGELARDICRLLPDKAKRHGGSP